MLKCDRGVKNRKAPSFASVMYLTSTFEWARRGSMRFLSVFRV